MRRVDRRVAGTQTVARRCAPALYLSPVDLIPHFRKVITALRLVPGRALVAVSGGADSLALLDLLVGTRDVHRLELVVAHVDHGIHPESGVVAARVAEAAGALGLRSLVGRLGLAARFPKVTETIARMERYRWLRQAAEVEGAQYIFLAHHADDQAETVLLRALKGSGVIGLRAMARRRGMLVRPLLEVPRAALAAYAGERGLAVWDDPANADRRHLRSWLRHEVLPLVRERVPRVDRHLRRTARDAARDAEAWDRALDVLPGLDLRPEPDGLSVAAPALAGYDRTLAGVIVRAVARRAGGVVGPRHAVRAAALAGRGQSGQWIQLGGGWMAELAFGRLHFRRWTLLPAPEPTLLEGARGELPWGAWRLSWRREPAPAEQPRSALTAWFDGTGLLVRAWRRGDRIHPLGGTGHRLAVRCFQDARVPAGRRARWPMVEAAGRLAWIPGVCRSDQLLPRPGSEALRIDAHFA